MQSVISNVLLRLQFVGANSCYRLGSFASTFLPRSSRMMKSPATGVHLSLFFLALLFFHISEYFLALAIHGRSNVNGRSLLITKQYIFAMTCGIIEYLIENMIFPRMKELWWVSSIGIVMIIAGEVLRKSAVLTAGRGFTHDIKIYHQHGHDLVTHGVYSYMRHPGYAGFLIWSIGTQVMLCNPICAIAYAVVLWRFFDDRIRYEEYFLRQFFGSSYVEYSRNTPSGIPFIR